MPHRKRENSGEPKPLNFDRDEEKGPSDHLRKPFQTPEEERGDNEDEQYYESEETMSPEETKLRKEEEGDDI